jgi:hypothetical protein
MARRIAISIVGEDATVEAELMEQDAPETCKLIWENLPFSGDAVQAKFCGEMILFGIPGNIKLDRFENARNRLLEGEVYYWRMPGGKYFGWGPDDQSEIAWAYGPHNVVATPFESPVLANVFARMVGDTGKFIEVCQRFQTEGKKQVEVRRVE